MLWLMFSERTGFKTVHGARRRAQGTGHRAKWPQDHKTIRHLDIQTNRQIDKKSWDHYQ